MIAALRESNARSSVRADVLRPVLAKYPDAVQKEGEAFLASLTLDTANQIRRLENSCQRCRAATSHAARPCSTARRWRVLLPRDRLHGRTHRARSHADRTSPQRARPARSDRSTRAPASPAATSRSVIRTRSGQVHTGVLRSNDLPDEVVVATERDETRIPAATSSRCSPGPCRSCRRGSPISSRGRSSPICSHF